MPAIDQDLSSARIVERKVRPASKTKTREITGEEAKSVARKVIARHKAAIKELARR
jgi:hypothetical protein